MASQLKVDTITGVTTAGSISVTGEGNSTTTNLQQGLAKAWAQSQRYSSNAINGSLNVSSLTDNATADFTLTFTNAFSDTAWSMSASSASSHMVHDRSGRSGAYNVYRSTTTQQCYHQDENGGTSNESNHQNTTFHGNLA